MFGKSSFFRYLLTHRTISGGVNVVLIAAMLISVFASAAVDVKPAFAAVTLTIEPVTWNIIGLDSNNVDVGPNYFPVGARVCNTSTSATTVNVQFFWDDTQGVFTNSASPDPYLNLRAGTLDGSVGKEVTLSLAASGSAGDCKDAYFEVEVTRDSSAYENTRLYYITATDTSDATNTVTTPRPRELFIEYLISQNRNTVTNVQYGPHGGTLTDVAAGGTLTMMTGQEYDIKVFSQTATQGYEQSETFISLPNTIFQVLSVSSLYSADTSLNVDNPNDMLYGDACNAWENNPLSPNYPSCQSTGKVGGVIEQTYHVKILQVPGAPLVNPEPLGTLIYDFSGSSFHYNADFGVSVRYAYILDPSSLDLTKTFTADAITAGTTSTLTIRIPNPTTSTLTGVNFLDDLPDTSQTPAAPGDMVVASTPNLSYTGCGASPSPSSLTGGEGSISFSGIEIASGTTCIIKVDVTVPSTPTTGTYTNTTGHLFINGTTTGTGTDTGNTATDDLVVAPNLPVCTTSAILASWTVPTTANEPPDTVGGIPTTANVTAVALGSSSGNMNFTIEKTPKWPTGVWAANKTPVLLGATDYFGFTIDTTKYKDITWSFKVGRATTSSASDFALYYTPNGGSATLISTDPFATIADIDTLHSYSTTFSGYFPSGNTLFAIHPYAGPGSGQNDKFVLDDIQFTGTICQPPPPSISKSFGTDPIAVNSGVSQLTFTITNTTTDPRNEALTGVNFSDTLPTGLVIASPANESTTCTSGSVSAPAGGTTISLSGASMAAGNTCYVYVDVKGTAAGSYDNVSGRISATESGQNNGPNGYATDSITVLAPPIIEKSFGASTILTGETTTYTFTLTNPNANTTLTGVNFTDTYQGTMTNTSTLNITNNTCGVVPTASGGGTSFALSGVTLAPGASCTVTVDVTATTSSTTPVEITDNTGQVAATGPIALTGNTPTATLYVKAYVPDLNLSKRVGTSATGPWYNNVALIPAGSSVYYQFIVENTGDVPLTNINITDALVSTASCTWPNPLPIANAAGTEVATCVVGPITPTVAGYVKNTATAHGTYSGTEYDSDPDTATYQNGNFGHLPSSYTYMNLFNEGGAFHTNGTTYLGSSVTTTATDGINTSTYTPKATDDGITWTGTWDSGTGYATVVATCDPAGTKTLYAWFDWNQDDDFNDTNEQYSWTVNCSPTGTSNSISFTYPGGGTLAAGTYYSRFRIYDSAPTNPQPFSIAKDASGNPIAGEIEDPPITSDGSGTTPTPVTLSYFTSKRQGSSVVFDWSTATETGNVGFNLLVEDKGQLQVINAELIPSQVIDSLDRHDYTFTADVKGNTFYIEDVSIFGETRLHGPFQLGQEYGTRFDEQKIDQEAITLEFDQKVSQNQGQLRKELKVPTSALQPSASGKGDMLLTTTLNLKVNQTGIQRVTYEMLRDAGLDLKNVPVSKLTLTNQGQVVPIYVNGNGKFGTGNFFEFYGEALDTMYTDTNIYTLQLTNGPSARIATVNDKVNLSATPVSAYTETLKVNHQRSFSNFAPGDDYWYDTSMLAYTSAKYWEYPFTIDGLADASSASTFELVVWGMTDWPKSPDHHLVVSVNGVQLADETFDGLTEKAFAVSLPAGTLKEGNNVLRLTLPGDMGVNWDIINLDKFAVTYQRMFKAVDGRLSFTTSGQSIKVTELSSSDVAVYRLDASGPVRLKNVNVQVDGGSYSATFAGTSTPQTYFITGAQSVFEPGFEIVQLPSNLDHPAEYLIIAHPNFIDGLAPLVQARQAQGLTVSVVDVNDLYQVYSYGVFDPQAIKDYIAYAANNLGTKYVLLVGGDTYDYRNFAGYNSISFIPSLYVPTGHVARFVPVDPLYTDIDGDNLPDLAIGRFPVRTAAELELMIDKTLAYGTKDYSRTVVFASDQYDGIVSFKGISQTMEAQLPSGWSVENIHLDNLPVSTARQQLLDAMNRGTALVNFTGHSGPTKWTFSDLFSTTHAAGLTNAGRPFVTVQWGCWNTYYVDPANNYLVQSLLFSGDKGAAAVLGASTLTESDSERLLGELLMPKMVTEGMPIGQALQDAKHQLGQTHPELLDVLLGWTLMGDPALVIEP